MTWGTQPRATMGWGIPADLAITPHPDAPWPEKPEPGPYLCQLAQDRGLERFPDTGAIVDEKIDGIRAIWPGAGPPQSREGNDLEVGWWLGGPLLILAERLCVLSNHAGPFFIDGELTVGATFDSTIAAHNRRKQHPDARIWVFDALPRQFYDSGAEWEPLHERKRLLREAFAMGPIEGLQLCPSWEAALPQYAQKIADRIMAANGEGVVVKDRRSHYHCTRSAAWQKLKRAQTYTVEITDWEIVKATERKPLPKDGKGRVAILKGTFDGRPVRIATIADRDRIALYRLGPDLIGKRCEVTAMERTLKGNLRQPKFLRLREVGEG